MFPDVFPRNAGNHSHAALYSRRQESLAVDSSVILIQCPLSACVPDTLWKDVLDGGRQTRVVLEWQYRLISCRLCDVKHRALVLTDVSGQPSSRVKQSKKTVWPLVDGTDRLCRNVGNYQTTQRNILEERRFKSWPYPELARNCHSLSVEMYGGADKSLDRPGRKQATATEDFEFHISYL